MADFAATGQSVQRKEQEHEKQRKPVGHQIVLTAKQQEEKERYARRKYERDNWEALREEARLKCLEALDSAGFASHTAIHTASS